MISGFSFIKNGVKLGYPFKESLLSLAPFVDEIVVAHGDSTDNTLEALNSLRSQLNCELRIIESPWDSTNTQKGSELARQTNIALDHCRGEICFYLQGDEVLPDSDTNIFKQDLIKFQNDADVDVLAFEWVHFYYSYDQYVYSKKWYRREARVVKKSRALRSFGDAQGFRFFNAENNTWSKPRAALSRARVFHYGWVRPPQVMAQKTKSLDQLWHGANAADTHQNSVFKAQYGLKRFTEQHPRVMHERINAFDPNPTPDLKMKPGLSFFRLWVSEIIEKLFGIRMGEFHNFLISKKY